MSISKTFLKTLSYGLMHMTVAVLVAYALSGSLRVALAIGLVEPCAQTLAFFFHEKAWHRFEMKSRMPNVHNSVIDSASPLSSAVEDYLNGKE